MPALSLHALSSADTNIWQNFMHHKMLKRKHAWVMIPPRQKKQWEGGSLCLQLFSRAQTMTRATFDAWKPSIQNHFSQSIFVPHAKWQMAKCVFQSLHKKKNLPWFPCIQLIGIAPRLVNTNRSIRTFTHTGPIQKHKQVLPTGEFFPVYINGNQNTIGKQQQHLNFQPTKNETPARQLHKRQTKNAHTTTNHENDVTLKSKCP